jgi:PAS domain S-box-containing protein
LEGTGDAQASDRKDLLIWGAPVKDSVGTVVAGVGVVADITEGKRRELLLHETEARRAALLETALDAVLILDQDRVVIDFNPAAEHVFKCGRTQAIGRPLDQFVPALIHPESALIGKRVEASAIRFGGDSFPAEVSMTHIASPGGIYAVYVRDITDRKRADELLVRQASQLMESNSDLQQFAQLTSHDLKEPLRIIAAYSRWLQDRYKGKLDADADEFLGYIVDGVRRMEALIRDVLAYSRVLNSDEIPLAWVESEALVAQAAANLRLALEEKSAKLTRDPLPSIRANEVLLVRVFQNLIGNAIKYGNEGDVRIHISASRGTQSWIFSVADNGIGVEPQHFDRIFGLFKRLHNAKSVAGSGMGLAICKKIVGMHGGKIWITSEVGKGSVFHFTIPD